MPHVARQLLIGREVWSDATASYRVARLVVSRLVLATVYSKHYHSQDLNNNYKIIINWGIPMLDIKTMEGRRLGTLSSSTEVLC